MVQFKNDQRGEAYTESYPLNTYLSMGSEGFDTLGVYATEKFGDGLQYHLFDLDFGQMNDLYNLFVGAHTKKLFPNGIFNWKDTFFEVSGMIAFMRYKQNGTDKRWDKLNDQLQGSPGFRDLAVSLTNQFEEMNTGREWDGEFYEEIEDFVEDSINKMLAEL